MLDNLIATGDVTVGNACSRSNLSIGSRAAVKLIRSGYKPTILVKEELMHTYLMTESAVVELRMINDKLTALSINESRVMSLSDLAGRHCLPLITIHQKDAAVCSSATTIVHLIFCIYSRGSVRINIRSRRVLRAENSHLIALAWIQTAIAEEKEPVFTNLLDVATLARYIISSGNLLAEIRIRGTSLAGRTRRLRNAIDLIWISIGIIAKTGVSIKLQHKNTTRP